MLTDTSQKNNLLQLFFKTKMDLISVNAALMREIYYWFSWFLL